MIAIPQPRISPQEVALDEAFEVYDGHLYYHNIDLMALVNRPIDVQGHLEQAATPMYVRRLESLRENYLALQTWFEVAQHEVGYPGKLTVALASKANPSQPVVKTLLEAGASYECSSSFDVDIVRHAAAQGWLDQERLIISNGFKIPAYANNLLRLRAEGFENLLPIFDDLDEITPFADSGMTFNVGLRALTDMNAVNRFGLDEDAMIAAVEQINAADNLTLTTFHAMQTVSGKRGLQYQTAMMHSVRFYAQMKRLAPSLHCFNLGGGLPGRSSGIDFQDWMIQTLRNIMEVCEEEGIPAPDLLIESGRYLVENHGFKLFRIVKNKVAEDGVPFYVIDGSIMTNFPDAWALGDHFTVLPVNNWNGPFQPARLSGLTCDQDDIYPTRKMEDMPLMLPADTDELVIGFFNCGAYQETLGGRGGSKHCLLPEGSEVVLETDSNELVGYRCEEHRGPQDAALVLRNMGYAC